MELKFSITNQTLKRVDENKPVEKSQDYLYCYFDFSTNDWENATNKYAIFTNEEYNDEKGNALAYEIIDNKCLVPNEILNSNELSFKVNVVGTNESGLYILPTSVEYVRLNKTGSLDGVQPSENAPTIYQKLASEVNASFSDLTYEFNRDSGKLKLNFISNDKSVKSFEVDLPTEELVKNVEYDVDNSQLIIEWENGQTTNIPMSSVVSTPSMIEITYEELKALKDNNELIVGQKYRIIDYETTTSKEKTKSAKHPFDIIVTAISENTFDENASAIARKGDKYFGTWYEESLSKGAFIEGVTPSDVVPAFSIIVDSNDEIKSNYDDLKGGSDKVVELSYNKNENGDIVPVFYKNEISYIEVGENPDYGDTFFYVGTEEIDGVVYDKWRKVESGGGEFDFGGESKIFVLTNIVVNPNSSTNSIIEHKGKPLDKWKIKYCFDNDKTRFEWAMPKPMIYTDDESWFERSGEIVIDGVTYYKWTSNTFNQEEYLISLTPDVEIGDGLGFLQGDYIDTLPSEAYSTCLDKTNGGKGVIYHLKDENDNECPYDFKNIIFNFYFIDKDNEDNSHYEWVFAFTYFDGEKYLDGTMFTFKNNDGQPTSFINNIIKPSIEVYENIKYYRFYGNVIYHDFELNDDFIIQNNIICGNFSYDNIIYDSDNCSIGNECNNNIINRYNNNISIGDNCYNNYIGDECNNIKIGENSYYNEIYSFCSDIIINGSNNLLNANCCFITMGINCNSNEFADGCSYITLGNGCDGNEFRVICENITMGNECDNNVFELESISNITFGNNCYDNIIYKTNYLKIGNYCSDNYFYGCELVCLGDYCKDNDFNGVNDLTANVNCCDNHIYYSYNITLGNDVSEFKCINKKIKNSTIGNGVKNIEIDAEFISGYPYYSINIKDGVQGVSNSSKLQVYIPKHNGEAIQSQITIDKDQKGQILMYWNDDKLKKVGYYLESNASTEWLPIPEENAGGSKLYRHSISMFISSSDYGEGIIVLNITNDDETVFTKANLVKYLYDNNYNNASTRLYPVSGYTKKANSIRLIRGIYSSSTTDRFIRGSILSVNLSSTAIDGLTSYVINSLSNTDTVLVEEPSQFTDTVTEL